MFSEGIRKYVGPVVSAHEIDVADVGRHKRGTEVSGTKVSGHINQEL